MVLPRPPVVVVVPALAIEFDMFVVLIDAARLTFEPTEAPPVVFAFFASFFLCSSASLFFFSVTLEWSMYLC